MTILIDKASDGRWLLLTLLIVVLSLFTAGFAKAQGGGAYLLRGRVVDERQQPIPMASVRLLDAGGKMIVGDVTREDGLFSLQHNGSHRSLTLEVRFVGYATLTRELELKGQSMNLGRVVLSEDERLLKEVTVVGKATEVVVRGDTIEYNAGSYTVGEGDAVEELLKKLPGAEVNEAGQITINGKNVSKIMVDGKRFFEQAPKVALKNLPADLIDKVQVHDRESDNARMTGFADGDEETIINLTVKKGKKKGLLGTAYAGAGTSQRCELNASLNRFSDDQQWTLMAGGNNTNNAGFSDIGSDVSQSILMGHMGSVRRGRGGSTSPAEGQGGIATSSIVGANISRTLSSVELSGGAFWGMTNKYHLSKGYTTNFLSTGNTIDKTNRHEENKKHTLGGNLRLEWKPSERTEVIVTPQLSYIRTAGLYAAQTTTDEESSGVRLNSQHLRQYIDGRMLRSELRAEASHRLRAGRTLALFARWGYGQDDDGGSYRSELLGASSTSTIDQSLRNVEHQSSLRTRVSYVEPLGRGYALQAQYQLALEQSRSRREVYELDPLALLYTLHSDQYSHQVRSTFLSHRAGISLKRSGQGYDITAGFNLDPCTLHLTTIKGGREHITQQRVLNYSPTLRIKYKPSAALDLGVDYRGRSFQPTREQLSPVEDVTNQTIIYQGNPNLSPGYRHNLFGRLSLFDTSRQSSLMFYTHLQYVQSDIVAYSSYDAQRGTRYISYTNVDGNGRIGLGGFYARPIFGKLFALRFGTQNSLSRQIGFVFAEKNVAYVLHLSESLVLSYRRGSFDTSLKGSWSYYTLSNTAGDAVGRTTHDYQLDWDSKLSLGRWTLDLSTAYRTSVGYLSGFDRDQLLVHAGLSFSFLKDKAATLRLKVYDMLAQKQGISRKASPLSMTTEESNQLGRYAMLHFIYRFNQLGAKAARRSGEDTPSSTYHRGRPML